MAKGEYMDGHMVVISHDRRYAWDFSVLHMHVNPLRALHVRKWDLTGDGINQDPTLYGSCRVAPVPLLHGLVTYEEVKAGRIKHALAFGTTHQEGEEVYPCIMPPTMRGTGKYGYRLQLDPSIDLDALSLPKGAKIIARALQEYGMIYIENTGGGSNGLALEDLTLKKEKWEDLDIGPGWFPGSISMSQFRVVKPLVPPFEARATGELEAREDKPAWVTPAVRAPRLQHRIFDSTAAKSEVSFHIYTPELYDMEKVRRFPVLYWLHGYGGGLPGVPSLARHFDAAVRASKTPPMLVVFANGLADSMWCDSKDGEAPMETIIVKELIPHIDATFRTIASREGRLVEGFSMGGYGAARLGFKYHDTFGAISILGGGPLQLDFSKAPPGGGVRDRDRVFQRVFGGDQEYYEAQSPWVLAEQNATPARDRTHVRQVIGDRDPLVAFNRDFHAHMTRLGIAHDFMVLPGVAHDPMKVLDALGEGNWEFYRSVFGAKGSSNNRENDSTAGQADAAHGSSGRRWSASRWPIRP
jgi:enterochelin esterase-like enzyme